MKRPETRSHCLLSAPLAVLITLSLMPATAVAANENQNRPPNVVFIMGDDLGVGELGCYGQTIIKTPHLDELAQNGMLFTQHYSGFPVCAPARASLMTGMHAGHCAIRNNGNPPGRKRDPEHSIWPGQIPLPAGEVTIGELFQDAGYATGAMGKWGLGFEHSEGDPSQQGFDLFFGYLCQAHAHNHYPRFLWRITDQEYKKVLYPGNDRGLNGKTYSNDEFFRVAEEFVRKNQDRPFFLYLPVIITHLAIQVPEDEPSLAGYQKTIPELDYIHRSRGYVENPTPRASYAAMVTRLDREIGELLNLLKTLGLEENTIVVFTSDNGPTYDRLAGSDSAYFNSAEGRRGLKGSVYDGGIREPLIVRWPGHIKPGTTSDLPTYFPDWLPTLMDLTGHKSAIPNDVDGLSFIPTLLGQTDQQQIHEYLYWEFPAYGGQQALRAGKWKAVRSDLFDLKPGQKPKTALYNIAEDPAEADNLARKHPDVVKRLEAMMKEAHVRSEKFPLRPIDPPKI